MSKKKNILKVGMLAGVAMLLAACGTQKENKEPIGIIQYAEHSALEASKQGFLEGLKENGYDDSKLDIEFQNAQGDQANLQTMVSKFRDNNRLNFAIATPAAQAMVNANKKGSTFFTAVTDPNTAGLVGEGVTGTTDALDINKQMELFMKALPNAKKVGIFYNSSEVNSETQAKQAKTYLENKGISVVEKTVTSTNDVETAIKALSSQVDAVYFPTDNTVASTIATIGEVLKQAKIPSMGSDEAVLSGVLFTYGVDYHAIGKQTGVQAAKMLKGTSTKDIPIEQPKSASVKVNSELANLLGLSEDSLKNIQ